MNAVLVHILNLPEHTRRRLAMAIFTAMVLVFLGLTAQLSVALHAEIAAIAQQRELAGQQQLALKSMQAFVENGRRSSTLLRNAFLQGDSEAVAEASLQSWLSDTAGQIGIEVHSISGAEPVDDGTLRMIGVRTSVTGTYERILQLLAAIEAARPDLTLVKGEFQSAYEDMMDPGQAEPRLTANLTVMGIPAPETAPEGTGQ